MLKCCFRVKGEERHLHFSLGSPSYIKELSLWLWKYWDRVCMVWLVYICMNSCSRDNQLLNETDNDSNYQNIGVFFFLTHVDSKTVHLPGTHWAELFGLRGGENVHSDVCQSHVQRTFGSRWEKFETYHQQKWSCLLKMENSLSFSTLLWHGKECHVVGGKSVTSWLEAQIWEPGSLGLNPCSIVG